jgi:biopolymer transport protein ExbB
MIARQWCWLGILLLLATITVPVDSTCRAADNAPAARADGSAKLDEVKSENPVIWFLRCSGLIGLLIFGLSVYFVALVIRMFTSLKLELAVPLKVATDFRWMIGQGNFQGAYDVVRTSNSFLGRVVAKGIEHLPNGLSEARNAMERTGDAETVRMEKQISMMAVLGTLGPMIGLIGTLKGMIASFSVIAMSGAQLKANEVANGISEALLLTFEGVSLSVPAIYFFAFFRNRIATISVDAMLEADDLLHQFFRAGRPRTATPAAQTAPVKTGKTG